MTKTLLLVLVLGSGCSFLFPPLTGFTSEPTASGTRVVLEKDKLAIILPGNQRRNARHCTYANDCWEIGIADGDHILVTVDITIYTKSPIETLEDAKVNARSNCLQSEVIYSADKKDSFELLSSCMGKDLQTWFTYSRWLKKRPGALCTFESKFAGAKQAQRNCASFEALTETATAD